MTPSSTSNAQLRPSDATNLAGADTGRQHLSHSRIAKFLSCHRKYDLHYNERLEPISRSDALSLGSAFQKAIEVGNANVAPLVLEGGVVVRDFVDEELGSFSVRMPDEPMRFYTQEAEDKHRVHQAIVRAAAALYLRTWPEPLGETREFEYVVRLRNPWTGHYSRTFDLKGYADGVIDRIEDEEHPNPIPLELVENKLVSAVKASTVQDLPLDQQLRLARYGLWRATGRPVGKVHYRWVKKPGIKQRQKETIEQFIDRIAEEYATRPEFYVVSDQPQFVANDDLLRTEMELWLWAEQIRTAQRAKIFDRNTSSCRDYGRCEFIEICRGDQDAMALYQVRPERTEA